MTLLRVLSFSVIVLLSYTLFANILPQVQSNPPEEDEPVAAGEMDMAGMIAWGERLFSGKGTCTLCHNNLGRAPDLLEMDLAAAFTERLGDESYAGSAKGGDAAAIEVYLRESMVEPSAYVVSGFGKKGTNDTVSPMPAVDKAPIQLSELQINALIAYLQDRAGTDITVPLPEAAEAGGEEDEEAEEEGPAETAEAAIEKFVCNSCHDLGGSEADVGPKLDGIGQHSDAATIREAILNPNAAITEGFEPDMMPQDYASQMRISELELIVEYLLNLPVGESDQ